MFCSVEEKLLVDTIEDVAFGKLCDVELPSAEPVVRVTECSVRDGNAKLIKRIRESGITHLKTITVHEGEAQQIEVTGSKNGFKFIKKIRL